MTEFDFWRLAYSEGWATEKDIHEAVELELITTEERDSMIS